MKWHKLRFNQIFKVAAALILLLSVGSISTVSEARHVNRHSHVRISRQTHRNTQKKYYNSIQLQKRHVNRHVGKVQQLKRWQISRNRRELYRKTFYDINLDRLIYRRRPLRIDRRLNKIGQIRSWQLTKYFSHNMPHRHNEAKYLLGKRHINYRYYGENIAASPLGVVNDLAVGPYDTPNDAKNTTSNYQVENGYQLANSINNASMYHDADDGNGHRYNILSPHFKRMGIGVLYNQQDKNYYMAIEFIN